MEPSSIVWRHDVAIDTCRRIIPQIAVCSQDVQEEEATSNKRSQQDEADTLLTTREPVNQSGKNIHNAFIFSTR